RNLERSEVLAIGADHLQAQWKALFAETRRKRDGGNTEQGPGRAIFRVAGIAQAFRRLAKGWKCQHCVEARNPVGKLGSQLFLRGPGGEVAGGAVSFSGLNQRLQVIAAAVGVSLD